MIIVTFKVCAIVDQAKFKRNTISGLSHGYLQPLSEKEQKFVKKPAIFVSPFPVRGLA